MPRYEAWNLWDRMSIDGKKYKSIANAVEASRKYLLRYVKIGHYACAQRDAISFYGIGEGSTMNAYIPIKDLHVYIVDTEDAANCTHLDDVGQNALISVRLPMNPYHDNVVMGGDECRAVVELSELGEDPALLFEMVELWNAQRERYYGE